MDIRRSKFLFFQIKDGTSINIEELFKGVGALSEIRQIIVYSVIAQDSFVVTKEELNLLLQISSTDWESRACHNLLTDQNITDLAQKGILLIRNSTDKIFAGYLENETSLTDNNWNELSAFYHFLTKWGNLNLKFKIDANKIRTNSDPQTVIKEYINHKGFPPTHFYNHPNPINTFKLPCDFEVNDFFKTLVERKTTRLFDEHKILPLNTLSNILYYTFGCHGISSVYKSEIEEAFALKKTSPSGGGLHPTEAYLLINRVEGLPLGLYHYSVQRHSLELIRNLDDQAIRALANSFTAGQDYPSNANVVFILTSRYYRNFWKYDQHPHAYKVLLMDAAHLSQTFYLTCTNLKLGAFTTAAINAKHIESELNINGFNEGAILVVGCGFPLDIDLAPNFETYSMQ